MTTQWFYADAQNQQQGPVDAAALAALFRDGRVHAETLVWREGLAGWVPLRTIAAQLGLIVVNAPGAAPSPATPQVRIVKPSSGSGGTVGLVIGILVAVFLVIPILAAIALPAYQDYSVRAKIAQAVVQADGLKMQIAEYRQTQQRCPRNGEEGFGKADSFDIKNVSNVEIGPLKESRRCALRLTFNGLGPSALEGKKLLLSYDEKDGWQHSSDMPPKYLPASFRK